MDLAQKNETCFSFKEFSASPLILISLKFSRFAIDN